MSTIEDAIAEVLGQSTALDSLVDDRISWGDRPQGDEVPCLVFRCGETQPMTSSGAVRMAELELVGIAATVADASAVAYEAYDALEDEPLESLIGDTERKFVSISAPRITIAEPETGEAEARAEVVAVVACTLYYR